MEYVPQFNTEQDMRFCELHVTAERGSQRRACNYVLSNLLLLFSVSIVLNVA